MSDKFEIPRLAAEFDVECQKSCGDDQTRGGVVASQPIDVPAAANVQHAFLYRGEPAETVARRNAQGRRLERSVSWTTRERLRCYWLRFRLTVAEMNYASRRLVELQAPWITDSAKARHPSGRR